MASGDSDHIEVMESSVLKKSENATEQSVAEDDDRDRSSIAEKNVPYDPAVGPMGAISKVHKSDRKIGHRRVGEGGEITYKKIQSSQIMGSIQLGIQHAIGGLASKPERDLLMQDFMTVETTNFPHEGSNHTPAHHYSEFKFKTYAPIAFRYFRDLFGIQPDDFLMSMCSAPLRELSNPGASGSIFYLTNDDEFIIKTVQHKEGEFLQKLLPGYYLNLDQETLATLNLGAPGSELSERNKRTIGILRQLFPSLTQNSIAEENLLSGAESQQAEVRVAFGESGSQPGAAGADQQGAASEDQQTAAQTNSASIDEITLDDADGSEENRNKRFLSFGGAGGASGGGSGNFLFDIVRLVAGSSSGASGGEAAAEGDDGSAAKGDNLTEGVPGPITRLFIIANRGIANLIQDLILRIAQTSERIVNFKARLITSII